MKKGEQTDLVETPGRRIQRRRLELGVEVPDLAYRVKMSKQGIEKIEGMGPRNYPKLPNVLKIAWVLEMDPWEIAFGANAEAERARLGEWRPRDVGPSDHTETELRLPADLHALVQKLRAEIREVRTEADKALARADEAIRLSQRRA